MQVEVCARAMAAGMSDIERCTDQDKSPEAARVKHAIASPSGDGDRPWTTFGLKIV